MKFEDSHGNELKPGDNVFYEKKVTPGCGVEFRNSKFVGMDGGLYIVKGVFGGYESVEDVKYNDESKPKTVPWDIYDFKVGMVIRNKLNDDVCHMIVSIDLAIGDECLAYGLSASWVDLLYVLENYTQEDGSEFTKEVEQ